MFYFYGSNPAMLNGFVGLPAPAAGNAFCPLGACNLKVEALLYTALFPLASTGNKKIVNLPGIIAELTVAISLVYIPKHIFVVTALVFVAISKAQLLKFWDPKS